MTDPDISKLPVITCWPNDGGPFVTLPIIHTHDLHTGTRNVGMYRMQVFGPTLTGHALAQTQGQRPPFRRIQERPASGCPSPLPSAATLSMPIARPPRYRRTSMNTCSPASSGRKERRTRQMPHPAGDRSARRRRLHHRRLCRPDRRPDLGRPFGDHTGYYSLPDWYPRFHITAITHRKNPVYPATIVGIPPQEDAWLGKATERIFLAPDQNDPGPRDRRHGNARRRGLS